MVRGPTEEIHVSYHTHTRFHPQCIYPFGFSSSPGDGERAQTGGRAATASAAAVCLAPGSTLTARGKPEKSCENL